MNKHRAIYIVLIAAVLLSAIAYLGIRRINSTDSLVKVDGYKYIENQSAVCMALAPECGVCYGKIINKECWVDPKKLTPEEKQAMRIE